MSKQILLPFDQTRYPLPEGVSVVEIPGGDDGVEYRIVVEDSRYAVGEDGSMWSSCKGAWRKMKHLVGGPGYPQVCLGPIMHYVHRLVLRSFIGPPPKGCECCHGPNGKMDPSVSNLRWDIRSENLIDNSRHGNNTFTEDDVRHIRHIAKTGARGSLTRFARSRGVPFSTVYNAVSHGYRWVK